MKPYGFKHMRKPPGDGCHLCMKGLSCSSKRSKSANRQKAKRELKDALDNSCKYSSQVDKSS